MSETPKEEKGIFSDPSLWKLNTNPVVKGSLTTQKEDIEQGQIFDVLCEDCDERKKLQSENDQLKVANDRLRYDLDQAIQHATIPGSNFRDNLKLQEENDQLKKANESFRKILDDVEKESKAIIEANTIKIKLNFDECLREFEKELTTANKVIEACREGLDAVQDLMCQSEGVCGLHRNGDIALWSELCTGGHFEEWLIKLDDAVKLIDTIQSLKLKGKEEL